MMDLHPATPATPPLPRLPLPLVLLLLLLHLTLLLQIICPLQLLVLFLPLVPSSVTAVGDNRRSRQAAGVCCPVCRPRH